MLEFRDLVVDYGSFVAIDELSLTVRSGELMTLLGPSGCGKSTLIRTAGGFLRPQKGAVWLDGEDVTNLPPEARQTATVFQSHALFPHMSVGENVAYGLRARGTPRRQALGEAAAMLERVGLGGMEKRPVQALSGGQQQRVALARALVLNPKVLLLDEPLSSLDASLRVRLRQEIRHLQKDLGMTALYVTHDREESLSISDRVAVMKAGRLVQVGSPEEIYGKPVDDFVARFVSDANILPLAAGGEIYLRPGQLDMSRGSDAKVLEREFKGEIVTYLLQVQAGTPNLLLPDGQAVRVAEQKVRVDMPWPERFSFVAGDVAALRRHSREEI